MFAAFAFGALAAVRPQAEYKNNTFRKKLTQCRIHNAKTSTAEANRRPPARSTRRG